MEVSMKKKMRRRRRCIYEGEAEVEDVFIKRKMYLWERCIYEAEDIFVRSASRCGGSVHDACVTRGCASHLARVTREELRATHCGKGKMYS